MNLNFLLFFLSLFTYIFAEKVVYEAEDGELEGITVFDELPGFSGKGYVGRFENPGNKLTITVEVKKTGMYDLDIIYCGNMGQKINSLVVNGESTGDITFPENKEFETISAGSIYLKEGKNTISLVSFWGWMWVDAFVLNDTPNEAKDLSADIDPTLINPKAIPAAKKLYDFLRSNYGKRILSGQVGAAGKAGDEGEEFKRIQKATGKLPAVWNMDFIFESNDCTWRPENPDIIEMALDWWKKYEGKGIMSAQWHWNIAGKTGDFAFYKKDTTFDLEQAVTEGTWENEKIIKDIDRVAGLIKKLQEVNMPLLWRPLHENNGDWFWWGNNPKATAKLWKILYERMVNHHGLNNLIWLWNGNNDADTPIDYIDIVGVDIYANDHGPQTTTFNTHFDFYKGKKMVVLSENGRIPDIQQCVDQGAWWGYFQTWNNEFILQDSYHTDAELKEYFNHEAVMNMDELPSFNVESYEYANGASNSSAAKDDKATTAKDDKATAKDDKATTAKDDKATTAKDDKTADAKDDKATTAKDDKTADAKDDKATTAKDDKTATAKDDKATTAKDTNKKDECFSVALGYKCCKGNDVVLTDDNGDWGVEDGKWCGIANKNKCFSVALGYDCCEGDEVVYVDADGTWGQENGKWCGLNGPSTKKCWSEEMGYPCCKVSFVYLTDSDGYWGVEDKKWCGINV